MTSQEVHQVRLSEEERDALFRRLDDAATYLGADKAPKMAFPNGDGTWDVGCTLEGDRERLVVVLSLIHLGREIPPPASDDGEP